MKATNSLSTILGNIHLNQNNILKISEGFLKALSSSSNNITVDIENVDGTTSTINIPTNIFINNELQRLVASFRNVVGLTEDGKARIISNNGEFREIIVSDYLPSLRPENSNMTLSTNINISTNSIIENMISPLTEVEILLDKNFNNVQSAFITKIITNSLDGLSDGMTFGEVKRFLSKANRDFEIITYKKETISRKSRYYGSFNIESYKLVDLEYEIKLSSIKYSDEENLFEDTKTLNIGDTLTNYNGTSLYEITQVSYEYNTVKCKHIAGVGALEVGKLMILKDSNISNVGVRIPVRLNEKSIIFLEVVDKQTNASSAKSTCKLFDSNEYIVNDNGIPVSFNEYFSAKVADIGRHIESLVRENSIPFEFGEKPVKPTINESDLNVLQINKHLTNTPNTDKIRKSSKEKDQLMNQIQILNSNIADLNAKISESNYTNVNNKSADKTQLSQLINEKKQKTELLDSITKDIKSMLEESAEISISPKYRVRGFWEVPKPLPSNITNPQHIVQYEVRYRYVSNTGNTANSSEMIYQSGENQINAAFSAWNNLKTGPLEKVIDKDGKVSWMINDPTNVDKVPINQLDIPISYGESVELQIRAVSEAGWPNSPIKSDWSNLIRKDFPVELLQETDLATIQKRNNEDLLQVKVMQEFGSQGVTEHISTSFRDGDKYFPHSLKDIGSGKLTEEQKQIDAETYISALVNRVRSLEELVNRRYLPISVQIVDENLVEHDVANNGTVNLFAGNYLDLVNMQDPSNYGTIITKKFYIKLVNRNAQTVELLSLNPGVNNQNTQNSKYNSIPIYLYSTNQSINQRKAQIFYSRNKNVDFTEDIYKLDLSKMESRVNNSDIDFQNQYEASKNIVNFSGTNIELVALNPNASLTGYVTMTTSHPVYQSYVASRNLQELRNEFNRIVNFNNLYKENDIQNATKDGLIIKYSNNDKHLVGKSTCGSNLYIAINDIKSFQVEGIDTSSSKEINSGETDSILIPVEFQFRMSDALGKPDGVSTNSLNSNFMYSKKLGIDLLINGKLFSFDMKVSSRFRSTSVSNASITNGQTTNFNPQIN